MPTILIIGGAIVGNMALIFGLLSRPRSGLAVCVGLAAYAIATLAWLVRRWRDQQDPK